MMFTHRSKQVEVSPYSWVFIFLLLWRPRHHRLTDPRTKDWFLIGDAKLISAIFVTYLLIVWLGPKYMRFRRPYDLKKVIIPYNFALHALSVYMCYEVSIFSLGTCIKRYIAFYSVYMCNEVSPHRVHSVVFIVAFLFLHQFLSCAYLSKYSLVCQPVDYSTSPLAMRVRFRKVHMYFVSILVISSCCCRWRACVGSSSSVKSSNFLIRSEFLPHSPPFLWCRIYKLWRHCWQVFFIMRKKNSQVTFLHVYHHCTMIVNWWFGVKLIPGGQGL